LPPALARSLSAALAFALTTTRFPRGVCVESALAEPSILVSTVKLRSAGVGSALPTVSVALAANVCGPSASES